MPGLTDAEIAKLESAQTEGLSDDEINQLETKNYHQQADVAEQGPQPATPEESAYQIRKQFKEPGEYVFPPEMHKLLDPVVAGGISGLTSGIVQPPQDIVQESPGQVMAGEAIGGMAQAALLPAKKLYDAGSGAVQGYNATPGTIPQKVIGGIIGGGIGLGLGIAGRTAGKLLSTGAEFPEKAAQKAIGLQSGDLFRIAQKGKKIIGDSAKDVANTLKEAGIFNKGAAPEAIERSIHEIRSGAGQQLDNIFANLDATGHVVPSAELTSVIDQRIKELKEFPEAFGDKINRLEAFQRDLELSPTVPASKLRTMTQIVADETFDKSGQIVDKEAFKVWQSLKDATDNLAAKVGGPIGDELTKANKIYHASQQALPAVARKVAKEETTSLFTNPLKKTGQAVESEVVKSLVGSPEWLQKNIKRLGKFAPVLQQAISRGGQAAAVNFFRLSQTNAEFREKLKELEDQDNGSK